MAIVLENQVAASEKSACELGEELQRAHKRALLAFDIRDLARSVVTLFRDINADIECWQKALDDSTSPASEELADLDTKWHGLYCRLANVFEKTAALIRGIESIGPEVDGKPEFFKAWRELRGVVCFSHDRVAVAIEQANRNEARSLGEITSGLFTSSNDRS